MTGDRRKYPRAPVPGDGRELPPESRRSSREPAGAHFRRLGGQHDSGATCDGAASE